MPRSPGQLFTDDSTRWCKIGRGCSSRPLDNVRATETAADVSVLPREMSRSDRGVRNREALSVCPNPTRGRKKRDRGTLLDLLITCERPKRRQTFPFSLVRCHAVTEGYEAARPGAIVPNSTRGRIKKETGEHSSISKKRASDRNGDRRFRSPPGDVTQ